MEEFAGSHLKIISVICRLKQYHVKTTMFVHCPQLQVWNHREMLLKEKLILKPQIGQRYNVNIDNVVAGNSVF